VFSSWPKGLYPLAIAGALIFYLLSPFSYRPTDSSYLHARYAQNLLDGEGFVYNPGERILLTSAPLIVFAQAAFSLPSSNLENPPEFLSLLVMALSVAALIRRLKRDEAPSLSFLLVPLCLLTMWSAFGGVESWLLLLSLLTLDALDSERVRLAGLLAGLALLVSPLALIFGILTGAQPRRSFWLLMLFPSLIWWTFAWIYFEDLQGLTLNSAPGEGAIGVLRWGWVGLLPLILWMPSLPKLPRPALVMVVWGLFYSLVGMLFNLSGDATVLTSAFCLLGAHGFRMYPKSIYTMGLLGLAGFLFFNLWNFPADNHDLSSKLEGSKGHFGDNREAFLLGGTVYQLDGQRDLHLRFLVERGDRAGVLLATVPDFLLGTEERLFPDSLAIALLDYQPCEIPNCWQRGMAIFPWETPQEVEIPFGPDLRLVTLTQDRREAAPGEIIRLRLDWERGKAPQENLQFGFNTLDFQQASFGSIQQEFLPQIFEAETATTYHVIPLNPDAPPGRYTIHLVLGYDAGIIARQVVAEVKIPSHAEFSGESAPIAHFGKTELLAAEIVRTGTNFEVRLTWRAGAAFDADYIVFVHLTLPNDPAPLAQGDSLPMGGRYPTSLWAAGEVIEDTHTLSFDGVPPGRYIIRAGFFHPELGRIPGDSGDSVIVGEVEIE
jgi:hypothetical protein